jgi:uncharacterized protein YgiM (DUF1202 family)
VSWRRALLLLPILAAAPGAYAETLYVIEQLVVNVNSAPDGSGERVASIKSGDAVEVLERQGDQVRVHLANGTEGWIRKSYLSADEPLQHRLGERTAEVEQLKQDIRRLEAELASAQSARSGKSTPTAPQTPASTSSPPQTPNFANASDAAPSATTAKVPVQASNATPGAITSDPKGVDSAVDPTVAEPSYFMSPPETPARPAWHWALGSSVIGLALGFVLGWQVLDRRIRRKYGGLRIY